MNLISPLPRTILVPEEDLGFGLEAAFDVGKRQGVAEAKDRSHAPTEQKGHAILIAILAKGASLLEAAELCDLHPTTVGNLLRQDWFQAKLAFAMQQEIAPMAALFKGAAMAAFATVLEISQDEKAPKAVRLSAAKELLDRHLGKSTQFLEVKSESRNTNVVEENKALELEARQLSERLKL